MNCLIKKKRPYKTDKSLFIRKNSYFSPVYVSYATDLPFINVFFYVPGGFSRKYTVLRKKRSFEMVT